MLDQTEGDTSKAYGCIIVLWLWPHTIHPVHNS